jgi:hypothetical protein
MNWTCSPPKVRARLWLVGGWLRPSSQAGSRLWLAWQPSALCTVQKRPFTTPCLGRSLFIGTQEQEHAEELSSQLCNSERVSSCCFSHVGTTSADTGVSELLGLGPLSVTFGQQTTSLHAACVGCQLRLTLFLVHRFLSPWWWRR